MRMFFYRIRAVMITVLFVITLIYSNMDVTAAGSKDVLYAVSDDDIVKVYIDDTQVDGDAKYQIGADAARITDAVMIEEDDSQVRTLIMIDNSISIPKDMQQKINESIKAIINSHGKNEVFRIATFSEQVHYLADSYSNDYTALLNVADSVTYNDQDTFLTDVLWDVIDDIDADKNLGLVRLIIYSDGVDNKPIGITREELNKRLDKEYYPVYTYGVRTKNNENELENLFSLSRYTGADYGILNDLNGYESITDDLSTDGRIAVYTADIPDAAKTGGVKSSQLMMSDGTKYVCDIEMPFSVKDEKVSEQIIPTKQPVNEDSEDVPVEGTDKWRPALLACICVLVIAGIVLLVLRLRKKKKADDYLPTDITTHTSMITGRITLTDAENSGRSYKCSFNDGLIRIGRRPDNDIIISDDTSVSGYHLHITVENEVCYVTELKDVKNHSSINGIDLKPEIKQLIVGGAILKLGRHRYKVDLDINKDLIDTTELIEESANTNSVLLFEQK